jgi:WhiB family redox-sensing transcriptional regulator
VTKGEFRATADIVADWRTSAACAGLPHAVFFPIGEATEEAVTNAKAICNTCPVAEHCLEFALETNQRAGIWGGTAEEDRKALRRKWLAARRRAS